MIRYFSTRGERGVSLESALLRGLASDGGLYLPNRIPPAKVAWRKQERFADLAVLILRPFLNGMVPERHIAPLLRAALNFPVPLVHLPGWQGVTVVELFHGPTHSFKDFGARTMARLMTQLARHAPLTIVVATSGDTGSAVADGFAGLEGLRVALLFPDGQVSPTQAQQLTLRRPGVRAFAVRGTFDDCQAMVKGVLAAPEELTLSAANSISVGRLLPQMLYYYWAVSRSKAEDAIFSVPCGNLGNLTGGVLATLAGLPVGRFLAAHNANAAFIRYLEKGDAAFGPSVRTLSNAMDVGSPSNFERLRVLVPDLRDHVTGYSVSDEATLRSMRRVHEETGYVADPHTAVALEAVRRHRRATGRAQPALVLATAHPAKFPATVRWALGREPDIPPGLAGLSECPKQVRSLKASRGALIEALRNWQ